MVAQGAVDPENDNRSYFDIWHDQFECGRAIPDSIENRIELLRPASKPHETRHARRGAAADSNVADTVSADRTGGGAKAAALEEAARDGGDSGVEAAHAPASSGARAHEADALPSGSHPPPKAKKRTVSGVAKPTKRS